MKQRASVAWITFDGQCRGLDGNRPCVHLTESDKCRFFANRIGDPHDRFKLWRGGMEYPQRKPKQVCEHWEPRPLTAWEKFWRFIR